MSPVRVPVVMLCETFEVHQDSRVSVVGGAPEAWWVPTVPWTGSIPVVVIGELDDADDPKALQLEVVVVRPEDDAVVGGLRPHHLQLKRDPAMSTGTTPVHLPVAGYLDVTLDRVGPHVVLVRDAAGQQLASYGFGVLLRPE